MGESCLTLFGKRSRLGKRLCSVICAWMIGTCFGECVCLGQPETYLSPSALAIDGRSARLYIAAATAGKILVWDTSSRRVVQEIAVGLAPRAIALSRNGQELYVTSALPSGAVLIVDTGTGEVKNRVPVGHTPVAVALSSDGRILYVANQFDNSVSVVDLQSRKQTETIDVLREPVGLALTPAGDAVFVINRLPVGAANGTYLASALSVIDTAEAKVTQTIELPDGATNLQGITLSPDGQYAYVAHVLARYKFPVTFLERAWVNTNALSVIHVPDRKFINTVLLDDSKRGAADPYAVACTAIHAMMSPVWWRSGVQPLTFMTVGPHRSLMC